MTCKREHWGDEIDARARVLIGKRDDGFQFHMPGLVLPCGCRVEEDGRFPMAVHRVIARGECAPI